MADQRDAARRRLLRVLLKKVEEDTYPSATMMDLIEEILEPDDVRAYVEVLTAHIESDTYPSTSMIERVRRVTS